MEYNAMNVSEGGGITIIRVSNASSLYYAAEVLEEKVYGLDIIDTDSGTNLQVLSKHHAESLIRGLEKAIDLGWVD